MSADYWWVMHDLFIYLQRDVALKQALNWIIESPWDVPGWWWSWFRTVRLLELIQRQSGSSACVRWCSFPSSCIYRQFIDCPHKRQSRKKRINQTNKKTKWKPQPKREKKTITKFPKFRESENTRFFLSHGDFFNCLKFCIRFSIFALDYCMETHLNGNIVY